jgi:hypothetical protein
MPYKCKRLVKFRAGLSLNSHRNPTVKPANLMGYLYLKNLVFKNLMGGPAVKGPLEVKS